MKTRQLACAYALAVLLLGSAVLSAQQKVLLVHLPGAPVQEAQRLAEAANSLASYLSEQVQGLTLEVQLFRRITDADAYLQGADGARVVAFLVEPCFLLDLGAEASLVVTHRFQRDGKGTYRRLLVVKADAGVDKLADLKESSLSIVETAGASLTSFLERAVFEGEVTLDDWFGSLGRVSDDFAATAGVLYGQSDAALIGEHNPLLKDHLGSDLKVIYTSPPLSLPVLALRAGTLGSEQRAAWDTALVGMGENATGRSVLTELRLDDFEALASGTALASLTSPSVRTKEPEIALPGADAFLPTLPAPLLAEEISFDLEVELPDVPLPDEVTGH
jgi:ABC-type phosphate/phosphonate transport system substrate-binding protein